MRKGGYVKIWREILDHEIMASDWLCRLWLWCVVKANHESRGYRGETIERGQFVTGRNSGADQLSVSPSKFYRGLKELEALGCISLRVNSNWTTVSVCNYTTYQDKRLKSEQLVTQQVDSKRTSDDTTNEQQVNTNQETKKLRNLETKKKNTYTQDFDAFWKDYPRRQGNPPQGKANAFDQWQKIPPDELPQVMLALKHYSQTCNGYPKDPERFLKKDFWKDHLTPPAPATTYATNKPRNGPGQLFDPSTVF